MKKVVLNLSVSEDAILDIEKVYVLDEAKNFQQKKIYLEVQNDLYDERTNLLELPDNQRYHKDVSSVLRFLMGDVGGISEGELSRRTGVPQPTIHRILSGATPNPRTKSIEKIAAFFSINSDQLLGRLPLPKDRVPGTFNSNLINKNSLPIISLTEALKWPDVKSEIEKDVSRNRITTDISDINCYAIKIAVNSDLFEFRVGATMIVDPSKRPVMGSYVFIYSTKNLQPYIGVYDSKKNLLYLDEFNKKKILLSDNIKILGVIIEVRRQFILD